MSKNATNQHLFLCCFFLEWSVMIIVWTSAHCAFARETYFFKSVIATKRAFCYYFMVRLYDALRGSFSTHGCIDFISHVVLTVSVPSMSQIDLFLFEAYTYSIGSSVNKNLKKNCKYESPSLPTLHNITVDRLIHCNIQSIKKLNVIYEFKLVLIFKVFIR